MAFYGCRDDVDDCYSTPYSNYDFRPNPFQASTQYSSPYEFCEYKSCAHYEDDYFITPFEHNHSGCTYSKLQIEYHPSFYHYEYSVTPLEIQSDNNRGYLRFENRFTSIKFNEPEFEEYDPTPYGGGYDPATTYGRPLPPSDITCYPRTIPQPEVENFSYASIPSPYGKDGDLPTKPPNGESKPVDNENGGKVTNAVKVVEPSEDDSPSYERENGFENGTRGGDYGYESERQVSQMPYGSGLEAMDLCETIFGYWPCLAKIERQQQQQRNCQVCDQERRIDPWKSAADYLFGSPVAHDYDNYHHDPNSW